MEKRIDFTSGRIVGPLLKFAGPVLLALFLQAMYGAVDLLIVGKFASSADVSAVSTGSQIMMTITNILSSLCMGMTILLGQKIGEKRAEEGGRIVGSGLVMFLTVGIVLSFVLPLLAPQLAGIMHAPEAAYDLTVQYIRICGGGAVVIIAYNLIGGIFRGLGDSNTPLVTVLIACIFNIAGDLTLVAGFHMGTAGAAIATVAAQLISVVISYILISKKTLPFEFRRKMVRWDGRIIRRILILGTPIAVQDFLVGVSFLVILAIVNSIGLTESAGVGVAEKVCAFIMLVPPIGSRDFVRLRCPDVLSRLFPRRSSVGNLLKRQTGDSGLGGLSEGVRSGLPADVLSFLLHRLLQWNGKDVLRHDAGHPWCIRGARSGFISHEQADARFAVPYRAGNTLFNRCADHAVLYLSVASAPPRQSDIRQKLSVRVSRLAEPEGT